jgi:FixJ family two-component response regulator
MSEQTRPRILVVDDEEAILETMTFTFEDEYDVLTSSDARRALDVLDQNSPVAAVLTDQRMPNMSGVEFLSEVWKRHPDTVRMILTGFSDIDAVIQSINDGHVYAYITKPWEPEQLKQVMKQAVEHYELSVENERLVRNLKHSNRYLEAVMDQLDTGALAVDVDGIVQAANRPVRDYLALEGKVRSRALTDLLAAHGLEDLGAAVRKLAGEDLHYEDIELRVGTQEHRLRVTIQDLTDESGAGLGRVLQLREISHEPLQRGFDEIVSAIVANDGPLREPLERARNSLRELVEQVDHTRVDSPGMSELSDRLSRTLTANQNWLDVDDALAREDFPDAQLLQDRMRIAMARWPLPDKVPDRVRALADSVEQYYESGENLKKPVL